MIRCSPILTFVIPNRPFGPVRDDIVWAASCVWVQFELHYYRRFAVLW
jgi:hypothetical protein